MDRSGHESVSVVIPAFNEELRIDQTLMAIVAYMDGRHQSYEIIVADDGSMDATSDVVMARRREGLPITLARVDRNLGKGSAVRRGVAATKGDLVLMTDADLATPIEELELLMGAIRAGADIAFGSRGLGTSRIVVHQPIYRELMGKLFNVLVRATILPGIFDTQCGFKLFRGPIARRLFAHGAIDGFAFDAEILSLAARAACRLSEFPVRWSHVNNSKVSLGRDGLKMFRDVIKVAYRLRTGRYDLEALATMPGEAQRSALPGEP